MVAVLSRVTTSAIRPRKLRILCVKLVSSTTSTVSQNHGIFVHTNRHTCYFSDFCLFAPPEANTTIGDSEGVEVAWCTKKGHGARLIPEGTLQGVQLVQSPGYVQIVGFIDQTKLNIATGDYGGELDSGGQDGVSVIILIFWHCFDIY